MPKLTPEEKIIRDSARHAKEANRIQTCWRDTLTEAQLLIPNAKAIWNESWGQKIGNRELWLILGVFEMEEKAQAAGKRDSGKSRWFDKIASRADGKITGRGGLPGFTARTAARATPFIKISGNGYVWMTELGYALVQWLRQQHEELDISKAASNPSTTLNIEGLCLLPPPRWRHWNV
ncbi:MAG: hypothetical protein Q7S87_10045 [Agitococcus sp.]|nr:hypothetical protein [Agitococcus sp.]MDO9179327.1 hypothetical protein [Agitococcus sp.]